MLIRPLIKNDLPAVLKTFETAFGIPRSVEEWIWRYEQNPYGATVEVAWTEAGQLLAHYGVLHAVWQDRGTLRLVGQVVDVFTGEKPGLFRRGPLACTIDSLLKRATGDGKLEWLYGFPNRRAARLGQLTGHYPWQQPVLRWTPSKKPVGRPKTGWLQWGWDRNGITGLWERARGRYPFCCVRDTSFYEHRFVNRPNADYFFLGWRRSGRIRALAVLEPRVQPARWVDLLWDGTDGGDLFSLQLGVREEVPEIELWLMGDREAASVFEESGWIQAAHPEAHLVARSFIESIPHAHFASAYLTLADSDLV
jgi:hypothetical protein